MVIRGSLNNAGYTFGYDFTKTTCVERGWIDEGPALQYVHSHNLLTLDYSVGEFLKRLLVVIARSLLAAINAAFMVATLCVVPDTINTRYCEATKN